MAVKNRVTIKSIASELGVSPSTVSYVLHGKAREKGYSEETIKKIRQVADKLGYIPSQWARSLQQEKSKTISIVISNLLGGWADEIVKGVVKVLSPQEYTPIISLYDPISHSRSNGNNEHSHEINSILQRRDESVICQAIPAAGKDYSMLVRRGVRLVFIGSLPEDVSGFENTSSVIWDCRPAVKTAIGHLIDGGCRRIAFVGARHGVQSDMLRFNEYKRTLDEAGISFDEQRVAWAPLYKQVTIEQIGALFSGSTGPDAIFAINDAIAVMTLEILQNLGIKVPDDVAVIGMGNLPIVRNKIINLTTMHEPLEEIGYEAAKIAINHTISTGRPVHKKISCNQLVLRGTA